MVQQNLQKQQQIWLKQQQRHLVKKQNKSGYNNEEEHKIGKNEGILMSLYI